MRPLHHEKNVTDTVTVAGTGTGTVTVAGTGTGSMNMYFFVYIVTGCYGCHSCAMEVRVKLLNRYS